MPSTSRSLLPRRAFVESLILAAWAGEAVVEAAVQVGKGKEQLPKGPAPKAADARAPRLEDSGMRPKMMAQVRRLLSQPHGLIVGCGPTGPARTATLYACLGELDPDKMKILTVEDPIAYHLDRIAQKRVNIGVGQTFAGGLRSILEQHPDAVMIGEIRGRETAAIACRAATIGPLVLGGLRAGDTLVALARLLELGVERSLLTSALAAILAQRFVRLLCDACKEPYKPNPEFLRKANIPLEKVEVFYRRPQAPKQVCPRCEGAGYVGQTGIFELLVVNDALREMIRRGPELESIKGEARKNGLIYIAEDGLLKVIQGRTSVEELLRAIKEGEA